MARSFAIAGKDLRLLWRDKSALFWVIVFPLLLGVLFGSIFGGDGESSAISLIVVDQDGTKESKAFIDRLKKSDAVNASLMAFAQAEAEVRAGKKTAYLVLPEGYGRSVASFAQSGQGKIKLGIDPSKKAEAGMLEGVVSQAAFGGMQDLMDDPGSMKTSVRSALDDPNSRLNESERRFLTELERFYGSGAVSGGSSNFKFEGPVVEKVTVSAKGVKPASAYDVSFPQALVWGLLGVVTTFAISLVKERQGGTLMRLRVSPLTFSEILMGKGLACFVACVSVMVLLLAVGATVFKLSINSIPMLALAIAASGVCFVGVMMLLSTLGRTEQAVSGSAWGVLIIMAMFGGGMIPLFVMPSWMQAASNLSPLKWAVMAIEGALWRGFSFNEMALPLVVLVGVGLVSFGLGVQMLRRSRDL